MANNRPRSARAQCFVCLVMGQDSFFATASPPCPHPRQMPARVLIALGTMLPHRERDIVIRRFGLASGTPETYQAIAARYALSNERIRQLVLKVMWRLRRRYHTDHSLQSLLLS